MVKKVGYVLIFLFACHTGFGQRNVQQIFSEFSNLKNVEHVNLGGITMSFAGLFAETMGVKSIEVVDLSHCADDMKTHFSQVVKTLKDDAFETVVNTSENGERTKVLLRIQNDTIHELVVFSSGHSPAMIRLKGKIKPSDIERIIEKHRK
jgi:hypothetical protein